MGLTLINPPALEPITLAEAKAHARVTSTAEDSLVTIYIQQAREAAEEYTGRALMPQTWKQTLDAFPEAEIELLKPPVRQIASVTYVDANGVAQTLSSALYTLDADTFPGWLLPAYNTIWPSTQRSANAIAIQYDCGYINAAAVPALARGWLLAMVAYLYDNRAPVADGKSIEIPRTFFHGLDPLRIFKV